MVEIPFVCLWHKFEFFIGAKSTLYLEVDERIPYDGIIYANPHFIASAFLFARYIIRLAI